MFNNLKKILKLSLTDFENSQREEWLTRWASQIVLTVSQTMLEFNNKTFFIYILLNSFLFFSKGGAVTCLKYSRLILIGSKR